MIKRPKRNETEEDILRMQEEFLAEKAKNPKMQSAAQIVKIEKAPKKSLFALSRKRTQESESHVEPMATTAPVIIASANMETTKNILGEIHEKMIGDLNTDIQTQHNMTERILGDIVEKKFEEPKRTVTPATATFPKVDTTTVQTTFNKVKSIFAMSMEAKANKIDGTNEELLSTDALSKDKTSIEIPNLNAVYGNSSVVVEDLKTATEVHKENMELLSKMKEEEILEQRKQLLNSMDPKLVALLTKKRQDKAAAALAHSEVKIPDTLSDTEMDTADVITDILSNLPLASSNAAVDILQRSSAEQWLHFDVVEKDKLEWMRDIPKQMEKLKAGQQFEARFDWKGVLLPYSVNIEKTPQVSNIAEKDERELYLHADEPNRPGYTLQELFRLARSNVMQQRVSAFGAIAGLLNIYNQGFYDNVLELPISKIFFLLRFGLDDNTPAMLEVVAKALAYLFYNETDETLLDFIYDNPGCHWQPTLQVLQTDSNNDDPTSIENLQKQMNQLQMNIKATAATITTDIAESEEESKTSMSDFQLAEIDLVDCLLRTNILQRIYFVLHTVRPENSTVSSCLKLLIRLARSGKDVSIQIASNDELINCLFDNFLPGLERVDTTLHTPPFYNYPQYLCLKLLRVLISQNLGIAIKLLQFKIVDKLQNYLFNREDIKGQLIKTQIEALRILRCLLLLRVDSTLYKKFLPGFRYMLDWHYNHVTYELGGAFLIRQHAAALLAAITSVPISLEVNAFLGDILYGCCCSWFYRATRNGVEEFSQATLLSACLNAVTWYTRNNNDSERFRNFSEKYLCDFIASPNFAHFLNTLVPSSIILRTSTDRRFVHAPLPNVGAVVMHSLGPQLIMSQTYAIHLLVAMWRLLELQVEHNQNTLLNAVIKPQIIEPLVQYLRALNQHMNRYLSTNFYAKIEIKLIFKLLCFEGFSAYFNKSEMLQLVYNFVCCLTAEHIPELEELFNRVLFNKDYIDADKETLKQWRNSSLTLVHPHYIVVPPTELPLSMPATQTPILPIDWPYFQLKIILQNYIDNVQLKFTEEFSEHEVLGMTLNFVGQLEKCNQQLQIVTPTEKLMYLMIAFMGPDSQFLDVDIRVLLREHLKRFFAQCENYTFQFDAVYEGKCKFENLYALFVDHFQAASYGDDLFGSLVMLPLAQKYDNKWRRRMWSDYASALRFLHCDESLLLGGLQAYLEPPEQEESLLHAYATSLQTNLVRPKTLPYIIAKHHVEKFKERQQK